MGRIGLHIRLPMERCLSRGLSSHVESFSSFDSTVENVDDYKGSSLHALDDSVDGQDSQLSLMKTTKAKEMNEECNLAKSMRVVVNGIFATGF